MGRRVGMSDVKECWATSVFDPLIKRLLEILLKEKIMSTSTVVVTENKLYKGSVIKKIQELYPSGFLKATEEIAVISDVTVTAPSYDIARVMLVDLARVKEPKLDMKSAVEIVCDRFRG